LSCVRELDKKSNIGQQVVFTRTQLGSRKALCEKLSPYLSDLQHHFGPYDHDEILGHLISKIRVELVSEDFEILRPEPAGRSRRYVFEVSDTQGWIRNRLVPDTVMVGFDQEELFRLLTFCLAMPYKMFAGQTRATTSELVRRTKRRDFQQIFSDHFIGRIGEVAFKQFAKERFRKNMVLDWRIGRELPTFESDILNSTKKVSIRSTDTLESIWADAPPSAEYGIFVKVSVPKDFFMRILAQISSLRKLLEYIKGRFGAQEDTAIEELISYIETEAFQSGFSAKAFIVGFFCTSDFKIVQKGEELEHLGEIVSDKYFIPYSKLKCRTNEWENFFLACGLV